MREPVIVSFIGFLIDKHIIVLLRCQVKKEKKENKNNNSRPDIFER
jgi:hypothetical protein